MHLFPSLLATAIFFPPVSSVEPLLFPVSLCWLPPFSLPWFYRLLGFLTFLTLLSPGPLHHKPRTTLILKCLPNKSTLRSTAMLTYHRHLQLSHLWTAPQESFHKDAFHEDTTCYEGVTQRRKLCFKSSDFVHLLFLSFRWKCFMNLRKNTKRDLLAFGEDFQRSLINNREQSTSRDGLDAVMTSISQSQRNRLLYPTVN